MSSVEFRRFKKLLRDNNNFVTLPRMRLFGILQKYPSLTLKQLISKIPKHDQVTVYRNIDLFEKLGLVNRIRLGWNTKIELSDIFKHHHHHLTCVKCSKIVVLKEDSVIEQRIASFALRLNFKAMDHQLEIRGFCKSCHAVDT